MALAHPPPPLYTFRPFHHIHASPTCSLPAITHVAFISRPVLPSGTVIQLLTTDDQGWIAIWNLDSKRPEVLWRPHQSSQPSSNLGGCLWAKDLLDPLYNKNLHVVSQGRDNRFVVSRITALHRPELTLTRAAFQPTTLNPSLDQAQCVAECPTNALTFCKASCVAWNHSTSSNPSSWIIAAPSSVNDNSVDIFAIRQLDDPSPKISRIHRSLPSGDKQQTHHPTGPVMSLSLYSPLPASTQPANLQHDYLASLTEIFLLIGYESGAIRLLNSSSHADEGPEAAAWVQLAYFRGHQEPVFSVCLGYNSSCSFESTIATGWSVSADHRIIRYDLEVKLDCIPFKGDHDMEKKKKSYILNPTIYPTRIPCRFSVVQRSDGKIMATSAPAIGKIWIYACPYPPDPAGVLSPIGLLKVKVTEQEHGRGGGVLAFSPVSPRLGSEEGRNGETQVSNSDLDQSGNDGFGLSGKALLAAAGKAGSVVVWEVFP